MHNIFKVTLSSQHYLSLCSHNLSFCQTIFISISRLFISRLAFGFKIFLCPRTKRVWFWGLGIGHETRTSWCKSLFSTDGPSMQILTHLVHDLFTKSSCECTQNMQTQPENHDGPFRHSKTDIPRLFSLDGLMLFGVLQGWRCGWIANLWQVQKRNDFPEALSNIPRPSWSDERAIRAKKN